MAYSRNSRPGGGFRPRPSFGDSPRFEGRPRFNDRGPVEMHKAICDNCGKECEVPFRPTSGKPVYCSSCFESHGGRSDSRRPEGRNFDRSTNPEEKQMFEAVCDECGNTCQVPFRPSGDKPVYCSNCFGGKKNAEPRNSERSQDNGQLKELNSKLDRILSLLSPVIPTEETVIEEVIEKPLKVAKKKTPVTKPLEVGELDT